MQERPDSSQVLISTGLTGLPELVDDLLHANGIPYDRGIAEQALPRRTPYAATSPVAVESCGNAPYSEPRRAIRDSQEPTRVRPPTVAAAHLRWRQDGPSLLRAWRPERAEFSASLALRSGDVWVPGSRRYLRLNDDRLSQEAWKGIPPSQPRFSRAAVANTALALGGSLKNAGIDGPVTKLG